MFRWLIFPVGHTHAYNYISHELGSSENKCLYATIAGSYTFDQTIPCLTLIRDVKGNFHARPQRRKSRMKRADKTRRPLSETETRNRAIERSDGRVPSHHSRNPRQFPFRRGTACEHKWKSRGYLRGGREGRGVEG